jgi:hypothetical protein
MRLPRWVGSLLARHGMRPWSSEHVWSLWHSSLHLLEHDGLLQWKRHDWLLL